MILHLCRSAKFKSKVLQWYGVKVTMKQPIGMLGQTRLTIRNMREVLMQTREYN